MLKAHQLWKRQLGTETDILEDYTPEVISDCALIQLS